MFIRDLYREAMHYNEQNLIDTLDFLITEKKVLTLNDNISKFNYYLQPRFQSAMNQHLLEFKSKRGAKQDGTIRF